MIRLSTIPASIIVNFTELRIHVIGCPENVLKCRQYTCMYVKILTIIGSQVKMCKHTIKYEVNQNFILTKIAQTVYVYIFCRLHRNQNEIQKIIYKLIFQK